MKIIGEWIPSGIWLPGCEYIGTAPIEIHTEEQLIAALFGITQQCDSDGGECD